MAFGFLKRNKEKQKKLTETPDRNNESGYAFWENCMVDEIVNGKPSKIFVLPFLDICANLKNREFLTDVVRNDDDFHRRAVAFYLYVVLGVGPSDDLATNVGIITEGLPDNEVDEIFLEHRKLVEVSKGNCVAVDAHLLMINLNP